MKLLLFGCSPAQTQRRKNAATIVDLLACGSKDTVVTGVLYL